MEEQGNQNEKSTYTLNSVSVSQESSRLDFQHNIFLRMTETLLPPEITKYLASIEKPKIADVATGTGVWLKALSPFYPAATLHGYDFDITKFPNEDLNGFSKSSTLSFANILNLDTFPSGSLGSYDLVHIRLIMYGLKAEQWDIAAKNVERLLKPGGWVLWEETGYPSWVTLPPARSWYRILETDVAFAKHTGRDVNSPLHLQSHMKNAGLRQLQQKHHNSFALPFEYQPTVKEALIRVFGQAIFGIAERGGFGEVKEKADADQMVKDLREELLGEKGEEKMAGFEMVWVWGRKAE